MNYTHFSSSKSVDLTNDELRVKAPSVFAETPWTEMSSKYTFLPTIQVIDGMRKEGFAVVSARQSRSRIEGKGDFTKHMVRFRKQGTDVIPGQVFPEIVLVNSHDGTSAYTLHAGVFRLVCMNGMVAAIGQHDTYKTRHSGNIYGEVVEASYKIMESFPEIADSIKTWQGIRLPESQQLAYAEAAVPLRWEENQAKPEAHQLLALRRGADREESATLWGTYNRVQEALLRGGNRYVSTNATGQRTRQRSREVTGIDQDVKLNKALWTLTQKMSTLV